MASKKSTKKNNTKNIQIIDRKSKRDDEKYDWDRDTWKVLDSCFNQPNYLAHNQIESYNDFVKLTIPNIIRNHSPIEEGKNWLPEYQTHEYRYQVEFSDQIYMCKPKMSEGSGSTKDLYPNEARLRHLSYAGDLYLDVIHRIQKFNPSLGDKGEYETLQEKKEDEIPFKLQVMLYSDFCHLKNKEAEILRSFGECPYDVGGYFIINGSEKVIISQQRPTDNKVLCFKQKDGSKYAEQVEIRSSIDQRFFPIRNNTISLTHKHKDGETDQYLRCSFPYLGKEIPLVIVFRALGISNDKEIMEIITGSPAGMGNEQMEQMILPSFEELVDPEGSPVKSRFSNQDMKKYNKSDDDKVTATTTNDNIEESATVANDIVDEEDNDDQSVMEESTMTNVGISRKGKKKNNKIKITESIDALRYIAKNINMSIDYLNEKYGHGNKIPPTAEEKESYKIRYVEGILRRDLLPHVGNNFRLKALYLGYMCNIMLKCKIGLREYDDRDHYGNKRLDLCGPKLKEKFQGSFGHLIKTIRKEIRKALDDEHSEGRIVLHEALRKVILDCNIDAPIKKALATGDWSNNKPNKNFNSSTQLGVAQVLQRYSYIGTVSYIRRCQTPMEKTGNKITQPRKLGNTSEGYLCPHETPEGQQVGLVQNLAMLCTITLNSGSLPVKSVLEKLGYVKLEDLDPRYADHTTKIFLNGEWLGNTGEYLNSPQNYSSINIIYDTLKLTKRSTGFNPYMSIYRNYRDMELHIRCDGGRYTRPAYVVEKTEGKNEWIPKIAKDWYKDIDKLDNYFSRANLESGRKVKDLTWKEFVYYGYIEYLDPDETENCIIAVNSHVLLKNNPKDTMWDYTHLLIHPYMMNGVVAQMIPFLNHEPGPRNCFQSSMGKQAMGLPMTNYNSRMDTMLNILLHPERPLVTCRTYGYVNMDTLPHGQQCIVAVMCYGGYNQEDSILINKGSLDRGLFNSLFFRTYFEEIKPVKRATSEKEEFTRPNPKKTKGIKHSEHAYRHLDDNGLPKIGSKVEVNDVIIGKTILLEQPIKSKLGFNITHNDISTQIKQGDDGYVDMTIPGVEGINNTNSDGNKFYKVRIAQYRTPEIGDKKCSRYGQKGTISQIVAEEDMPFTDTGLVPDIIMNPHAYPSRMTIGQKLECLFGKLAACDGKFKDATAFTNYDSKEVREELKQYGFNEYCNEIMYNGKTGEQINAEIFIGPNYYQRLKHMVKDKIHGRSTGRVNNLTRQSVEGRTRDGGLRLGEMERDAIVAHGMTQFIKESFMERADKFSIYVGNDTQCPIIGNEDDDLYIYNNESINKEDVSQIQIPHALKLLLQELNSMGIDTKLSTNQY